MKVKQSSLELGDVKVAKASLSQAPLKSAGIAPRIGAPTRVRRAAPRRKPSNGDGNGEEAAQALLPLAIVSEEAIAPAEIGSHEKNESQTTAELQMPVAVSQIITDQLFLDTVRDQVYRKLIAGEVSPGMGDGFKAIEIKHKISEDSQNEKLLLEILSEIRSEELEKGK